MHAIALAIAACGDDAADGTGGAGCTTDVECKGDRVCVDHECVDPNADDVDAGGGAGSGGAGGTGGAAGTGGEAGTKPGGAGGGPPDDPELEKACGRNCEARQAAACGMNTGSLDQCYAQCLVIDEANHGYCLKEQTDQYACLAAGGYTCISGYPQAKSTCLEAAQALAMCNQKAPCRAYCDRKAASCGESDADCVDECLAEQASFSDAICGIYYTQLITCWATNLTCEGGMPKTGTSCDAAIAEVADCIGRRNHECDGFCWAAEHLGCGSESCVADCKAKADEVNCGHYYRNVLDCATGSRKLGISCEDGAPKLSSECLSGSDSYSMCVAGN